MYDQPNQGNSNTLAQAQFSRNLAQAAQQNIATGQCTTPGASVGLLEAVRTDYERMAQSLHLANRRLGELLARIKGEPILSGEVNDKARDRGPASIQDLTQISSSMQDSLAILQSQLGALEQII